MKVRADTEVAVLSARTDLDLAISTWLPGYVAQRTDDPEVVMDVSGRGGIVLVDLGSPRHGEWLQALHDRGFDGPTVFLGRRGDVTIDLWDGVVVPSPPSLPELLTGFEEARLTGSGPRRRRGHEGGARTPARGQRRRSPAQPGVRPAQPVVPSAVPDGPLQADRPGVVEASGSTEPANGIARRARRLDRRQGAAKARAQPAPRSDHRRSARTLAPWGSRRRRSATDDVGAAASDLQAVSAAEVGRGGGVDAGAGPERAFQAAFSAAETQPRVQRRVATPEGRIRVQTDEELFADRPAPVLAASGGGERGDLTVPAR